jgi:hypothetical protein
MANITPRSGAAKAPLPPGHEDFAGEIVVANGRPPAWTRYVPYAGIVWALAYYAWVRAFDPVNLAFGALFLAWLIYTPIAQKRGWFWLPM